MIQPVQIGDCTLYCGDMLEIVPLLADDIDHVISDPPYEDELHLGAKEQRIIRSDGRKMHGDLGFSGINADRAKIASMLVGKAQGWLILFCLAEGVRAWRDDIQAAKGKWDTTLAWVKPDASPRFNGQGAARGFECAVTAWCGKGYRSWNGGGKRGVFTHSVNGKRVGKHPTEKPVDLMVELVSLYSNMGQTILDPFMGGGSTGVACAKLKRKFIGIEQNPDHFAEACERMACVVEQPDMFAINPEPWERAETPSMFAE